MITLCIWPCGTWCLLSELGEYKHKSDDFERVQVEDTDDEDIEKFVADRLKGGIVKVEPVAKSVPLLRQEAMNKIREAETAVHEWFKECEVGEERTAAGGICDNVRNSTRVGPYKKDGG